MFCNAFILFFTNKIKAISNTANKMDFFTVFCFLPNKFIVNYKILHPLNPPWFLTDTPQHNSGLKENLEFPTFNYDFVVEFMCIQVINMIFLTWLSLTKRTGQDNRQWRWYKYHSHILKFFHEYSFYDKQFWLAVLRSTRVFHFIVSENEWHLFFFLDSYSRSMLFHAWLLVGFHTFFPHVC